MPTLRHQRKLKLPSRSILSAIYRNWWLQSLPIRRLSSLLRLLHLFVQVIPLANQYVQVILHVNQYVQAILLANQYVQAIPLASQYVQVIPRASQFVQVIPLAIQFVQAILPAIQFVQMPQTANVLFAPIQATLPTRPALVTLSARSPSTQIAKPQRKMTMKKNKKRNKIMKVTLTMK